MQTNTEAYAWIKHKMRKRFFKNKPKNLKHTSLSLSLCVTKLLSLSSTVCYGNALHSTPNQMTETEFFADSVQVIWSKFDP